MSSQANQPAREDRTVAKDPYATVEEFGAAAVWLTPFLVVLILLLVFAPSSEEQLEAADPLIQLLSAPWPVAPIALFVIGGWIVSQRPDRARLWRAGAFAGLGAFVAVAVALSIFALVGETLPSFIPPEESARSGITNGVAAGLIEEIAFRLFALPLLFELLRRKWPRLLALGAAALGTGILFSLSHELGPAGGVFDPGFLVTRTLFPGFVMSALALRLHPAFVVTAHMTGHLLIPALFV